MKTEVLDVPLQDLHEAKVNVQVVLVHQKISVKKLMSLTHQSILLFDVPVNNPAFLSFEGQKFAKGKVVQVNENYGLEIAEINLS